MCLGKQDGADPPRVKDPNFILGQTYVSNDESVERRCEAYGETLEIRNPNKHMGFDKLKIGGLSNGLSH